MARFRPVDSAVVHLDGVDYVLDPSKDWDDSEAESARVIARFPSFFARFGDEVESATAAPGEKRSTRRSPAKAPKGDGGGDKSDG